MENEKISKFVVPGAIVIAGLIIAGAIYYDRKSTATNDEANQGQLAAVSASPLDNLKPITDKDHVLGDPDALVSVITFTDLECSFCKLFHNTMNQIMDDYGKFSKVKWIIRHLPLDIHPKSKNEAVAAECANELGGNEAFWKYVDRLFEVTPSNNGLDPKELPKIAAYVGLDKTKFEECLTSGKYDQLINDEIQDGMKSGALGTPYAVVLGPNNQKVAIPGALPYSDVKAIIDEMLK